MADGSEMTSLATDMQASVGEKRRMLDEISKSIVHTRRCNKRALCTCLLRLESVFFQRNLSKRAARRSTRMTVKGKAVVKNLQQFEMDMKSLITSFLTPVELTVLGMVNHRMKKDVEEIAKNEAEAFVNRTKREHAIIEAEKHEAISWSRYMHVQKTCIHKMFVYYTGYRTGAMRDQYKQWAWGIVDVDPNEPSKTIMPNSWKFHDHQPWIPRRANGKNGEWILREPYKFGKAPKSFVEKVNEWALMIRPGSHITIAFQQPDATEVNWWEAQVWYAWRGDGREDPAIVYDPENDVNLTMSPNDLLAHFQANPTHVIDVCEVPKSVCRMCEKKGKSFYYCHLEKGHPML
ncbi:hypothetical protein Poli38472_000682 [Pythium oligandrum]|uniref:Uncharacterized protein n=1 Tax=Pythium oligandrum TaxID=41045 RepID=A0A8K1CCK1_PYTOL|nr:hypothetical protein Poli38472_000682 [Pythium oligandrum]|eukprot:TMW60640.1 hypothetical protein Poli38472_000682 [Pythium oligandrum]